MNNDSMQYAARLLKDAQNPVAFTGAGISTPSGIPDFRSTTSGLWHNINPMAVASLSAFRHNPEAFYNWIYPLAKQTYAALPNPAHYALAALESLGKLEAVVTQNIDMLHTRAGSQQVYEVHGHLREATCIHCFTVYPAMELISTFIETRKLPRCNHCGGILKPNVILFGEQLPAQIFQKARNAMLKADVILVVGSSLEVAPAGDLPLLAKRNGAQLIIINQEPTPADAQALIIIHQDVAEVLPTIVHHMEAMA